MTQNPQSARAAPRALGYARLVAFVSGPRAGIKLALLTVLLGAPSLFFGLAADDYELAQQVTRDPWAAYIFVPRDPALRAASTLTARGHGDLPWWVDPQRQQAFMRPLSSLSLAADFTFWPRAHALMHAENLALMALIVWLAFSFFRGLFDDAARAGLATFFYATQPALGFSVGWLSARNTLLATAFGFLTLSLDRRARRGPSWLRLAALLAFVAALLSAEIGLSALAFLLAEAFMLDQGTRCARALRLLPYLVITIGWRLAYRAAGYGVAGSSFHCDPSHDPLGFLRNALLALPTYLASALTVPFASLSIFSLRAQWLVPLAAVLILFILRPLFAPLLRADPRARYLALAAALATLPLGATLAQDRLIVFIGLGTSGLLATLMRPRAAQDDALPSAPGVRRLFRLHALVLPLLFVPNLFMQYGMAAGGGAELLARSLPQSAHEPIVLLNAPCLLPVHFLGRMRSLGGRSSSPVLLLSAGVQPVSVRLLDPRQVEIEIERGFLDSLVDQAIRDIRNNPFRAGDTLALSYARVEVLETRDGDPTRVRFSFAPTAPPPRLYAWVGREVRPFSVPVPGATQVLPALSPL